MNWRALPIAEFSPDTAGPDGRGVYRYTLWRRALLDGLLMLHGAGPRMLTGCGDRADQFVQFICLNPSTATETVDDPTMKRCKNFARAWGFDGFVMTNLFAFRATDPKIMKRAVDPVGMRNDQWILDLARAAGLIVFAWGTHGDHRNRYMVVTDMLEANGLLPKCRTFGRSVEGHPKHPLYLANSARLQTL